MRDRARWRLAALVSASVVCGALVAAARGGLIAWHTVRSWSSEEVSTLLGLVHGEPPAARPSVVCSGLAVLVLDDHPVAWRVAEALGSALAVAAGGAVPVHDASRAAFAPGDAERQDVLALVDLVHLDVEDWLVYQRCQVRLNVALGRPPRACDETRAPVRGEGEVLGPDAAFLLEYSVDGHWEVVGLAERGAHFTEAAHAIAADVATLVDAVGWVPRAAASHAEPAPAQPLATCVPPSLVPQGALQPIYDIVRPSGAREALFQVTTDRDWLAELERLEVAGPDLGWLRIGGARRVDGRPSATVLERAGERVHVTLAYMQGTERQATEQRQVLTLLHRTEPR